MTSSAILQRSYRVCALVTLSVCCLASAGCTAQTSSPLLDSISLPDGFTISVYADSVAGARSLAMTNSGTLFIGTRGQGTVYAVRDEDGDGHAESRFVIASGLENPNGVAFHENDLYVAEISKVWRYPGVENSLSRPPTPVLVTDRFPTDRLHGWKYIAFGPDDKLYVPVGVPCNVCEREEPYGTITRMNPDGSEFEIFARGVRNSVGFTWHPDTAEMWFTDNGRDMMGDDLPPDELNWAPERGMHFGFPYVHGGDIRDPEFGDDADLSDYTRPAQKLGPHVAALGLEFYTATHFPEEYQGQLFIAEHGSWNRTKKIGYRVSVVRFDGNGEAISYEPFANGWLQGESNWGRPVDLELARDGSLLVSDDQAGVVYRISYSK